MKIKIVIIALFVMIGCNQSEETVPTVSQSKVTAITTAIEKVSPGVVSIYRNQEIAQINRWTGRLKSLKPIQSSGSGFIISKDGYILTNAHNIITELSDPSLSITNIKIDVVLPGGNHYAASIVGVDSRSDVALLKIEGKDFEPCEFGDSDTAIVGEWVIALGNPKSLFAAANYQPIASAGIISAINADFGIDSGSGRLMNDMIQTDASLNSGNSGGPLVDANGRVLGINTFVRNDSENLGFAIPINYAKRIGEELKLKGFVDRKFSFGVNATPYRYGVNGEVGLYINSIDYDNSGDNKALYKGDIIIGVEGYQIQSYEQLQLVLANRDTRPGDTIKLRIQRENEIKIVNLVLGKE
ncbi:MAG: trypsin-like peptidase domain-containing protein [bacterium]|jgi:serine protease Do|nr:trypsin-like serine protease [Candidatus Neomarinimicrobiota bacterium]HIL87039.1 trypsin-like serine protease [Candidatus Neomarinimicrobiota bacterium]